MVVSRDIEFVSHCEHHVVPIIGTAHVSYLPNRRVEGISKIARVDDHIRVDCKFKNAGARRSRIRSKERYSCVGLQLSSKSNINA